MIFSSPILRISTSVLVTASAMALDAHIAHAQTPTETSDQTSVTTPIDVPPTSDTSVEASYPPDYFTSFQPNTANDMVRRIPGFTLSGGNGGGGGGSNARGFGQASLNILINGRRPSSKTSGPREILSRIPADTVIRIDIKDGASTDIPGLSGQVADIITGGSDLSGSWEYAARFENGTEPQLLDGEMSISGTRGALSYVLSVESGQFTRSEDGIETFADGNGTVFEDRVEDVYLRFTRPGADLNLTYAPDNGHIANLNIALTYANRNSGNREQFTAVDPRGRTGQSIFASGENEVEYEIGGDYAFPLPIIGQNGSLKLIGLHRFEDSRNDDRFREFIGRDAPFISTFNRLTLEGEYIGRAEYSFKTGEAHDWQTSVEGAFNYLDRDSELFQTDEADSFDTVRVEEKRAEANITHSWAISPKLSLQSSAGAEYSQLDVTTQADAARSFVRPKGFVAASYAHSPTYTFRARASREVGQLDFGDFTDGVNLTEDIQSSGNSEIVPTQFWTAELAVDRIDTTAISGTARAFIRLIEDPIDRIRFIDGSEGPGNLDSALEYGIEGNLTWILDSLGLPGMRLELEGALRDSEIDDPLTGLSRRINNTEIWEWEIDYRWDIPSTSYALGFGIEQDRESPFLRLDQTFDGRADRPFGYAFIEHKSLFGMTVGLNVQNIFDVEIIRPRVIYEPDRLGDIVEIQNFSRRRGRRLSLEFSGTF